MVFNLTTCPWMSLLLLNFTTFKAAKQVCFKCYVTGFQALTSEDERTLNCVLGHFLCRFLVNLKILEKVRYYPQSANQLGEHWLFCYTYFLSNGWGNTITTSLLEMMKVRRSKPEALWDAWASPVLQSCRDS